MNIFLSDGAMRQGVLTEPRPDLELYETRLKMTDLHHWVLGACNTNTVNEDLRPLSWIREEDMDLV